ncbi:MAG TPA: DUF6457 domain-containing protein [Micromonosporaceae bacterium]|nr:DUF6457 domain-containing protein [Micromonosporaceae bacterium]
MSRLDDCVTAACAELALDPGDVDSAVVLDLARDVAHGVLRPAAPITAYLLGLAVGRGADPAQASAAVSALAARWAAATPGEGGG